MIPLGGSKVELVERGPKGNKFGLKVTHPDFHAGRALILAAETADGQKQWKETLEDCSRVCVECRRAAKYAPPSQDARTLRQGRRGNINPPSPPRCPAHRSTMENAKLGDSMVERLRAEGTAAEKEKEDAMGACG